MAATTNHHSRSQLNAARCNNAYGQRKRALKLSENKNKNSMVKRKHGMKKGASN